MLVWVFYIVAAAISFGGCLLEQRRNIHSPCVVQCIVVVVVVGFCWVDVSDEMGTGRNRIAGVLYWCRLVYVSVWILRRSWSNVFDCEMRFKTSIFGVCLLVTCFSAARKQHVIRIYDVMLPFANNSL